MTKIRLLLIFLCATQLAVTGKDDESKAKAPDDAERTILTGWPGLSMLNAVISQEGKRVKVEFYLTGPKDKVPDLLRYEHIKGRLLLKNGKSLRPKSKHPESGGLEWCGSAGYTAAMVFTFDAKIHEVESFLVNVDLPVKLSPEKLKPNE